MDPAVLAALIAAGIPTLGLIINTIIVNKNLRKINQDNVRIEQKVDGRLDQTITEVLHLKAILLKNPDALSIRDAQTVSDAGQLRPVSPLANLPSASTPDLLSPPPPAPPPLHSPEEL